GRRLGGTGRPEPSASEARTDEAGQANFPSIFIRPPRDTGAAGERCGKMCPMNGTIEIGAVELFVRGAELRSFRGAGDALGVPRSTVSRRIADLEGALGTRL